MAEAEKWFRGAVGQDPSLLEGHYNLIACCIRLSQIT
jgi:hypothetical protein